MSLSMSSLLATLIENCFVLENNVPTEFQRVLGEEKRLMLKLVLINDTISELLLDL